MFLGCIVDPLNPQLHREEETPEVGILSEHTTANMKGSSIATIVELPRSSFRSHHINKQKTFQRYEHLSSVNLV